MWSEPPGSGSCDPILRQRYGTFIHEETNNHLEDFDEAKGLAQNQVSDTGPGLARPGNPQDARRQYRRRVCPQRQILQLHRRPAPSPPATWMTFPLLSVLGVVARSGQNQD